MQPRSFFAFGLATLCLLTSCQSRPAADHRVQVNGGVSPLNLERAVEDLDYFFKTVERVHPNYLANLSRQNYERLKDRSRTALEQAYEKTGYISKRILALTVAEAAATLGDGHTFGRLAVDLLDPCDTSPCMPPFRMGWQVGHFVVSDTREDLRHLQGARLLGINDRPLAEALGPIVAKISGERYENRIASLLCEQDLYWALIRPVEGPQIALTLRRTTGEDQALTVNLIPLDQYRKEVPRGPRLSSLGIYRFHHNDRICYWQYNSCNPTAQGREFIESVFRAARDRQTRNLILDLRFNCGGSDQAVQAVVDHLTSQPYRLYSRTGGRVSDALLQTNPQWYLRPLKGLYLSAPQRARRPQRVENRFEGSVYVLTSPCTFSAAADLAAVLKDYGIATLIGEETGGVRQSFGEACGDRLPNSGLGFSVSCKVFYAPVRQPNDARRGTVPDIVFTEELLPPFMKDSDPELAHTLDLIQKRDEH